MDSVPRGTDAEEPCPAPSGIGESFQLAVLRRLRRILEVYCGGGLVFPSDGLEWAYVKLRDAFFQTNARLSAPTGVDYGSLDEALPKSLGSIEPLALPEIWDDYIRPAIDSFRGEFLAACAAELLDPFDPIADQSIGILLGYDQPIDDYDEIKQAGERAMRMAIGQLGVGLRQAEDAAVAAMREAEKSISKRRESASDATGDGLAEYLSGRRVRASAPLDVAVGRLRAAFGAALGRRYRVGDPRMWIELGPLVEVPGFGDSDQCFVAGAQWYALSALGPDFLSDDPEAIVVTVRRRFADFEYCIVDFDCDVSELLPVVKGIQDYVRATPSDAVESTDSSPPSPKRGRPPIITRDDILVELRRHRAEHHEDAPQETIADAPGVTRHTVQRHWGGPWPRRPDDIPAA